MRKSALTVMLLSIALVATAQQRNAKYEAYIEKYKEIAIKEQERHHIPASITMAQALLESAAGESKLAVKGKNHFGIKCGSSWYGRSMRMNDDAIGECFRVYSHVEDSYEDHSEFLKKQRYSFLYDYDITDYKAWAHGLKRAGYATDPSYPQKLIKIIETYELYNLDRLGGDNHGRTPSRSEKAKDKPTGRTDKLFGYVEISNNGVRCVRLMEDDRLRNIAKEFGISKKMLLYFNDMYKDEPLHSGDYVYLWFKKGRADKQFDYHEVKAGESMHSIAQQYGVKMKRLYKMNGMEYGTPVKIGMILKLR